MIGLFWAYHDFWSWTAHPEMCLACGRKRWRHRAPRAKDLRKTSA